MNSIIISGRLTASPKVSKTSKGESVLRFSVAVRRNYKNSSGEYPTDFIKCVAWRNTADFIERNCEKGQFMEVRGPLYSDRYQDKDTGKNLTDWHINVEEARPIFTGKKKEVENNPATAATSSNVTFSTADLDNDEFRVITDDGDLPF